MSTHCDGCGVTDLLEKYELSFVGTHRRGVPLNPLTKDDIIVSKKLDLCPTCDEKLTKDLKKLLEFEKPHPDETTENLQSDNEGKCQHCQKYFVELGRICTALMASECDCPQCSGLCECVKPEEPKKLPRILQRPTSPGAGGAQK